MTFKQFQKLPYGRPRLRALRPLFLLQGRGWKRMNPARQRAEIWYAWELLVEVRRLPQAWDNTWEARHWRAVQQGLCELWIEDPANGA